MVSSLSALTSCNFWFLCGFFQKFMLMRYYRIFILQFPKILLLFFYEIYNKMLMLSSFLLRKHIGNVDEEGVFSCR